MPYKAVVLEQTLGQAGKFGVLWPDLNPPTELGTWLARNLTREQAERACSLVNDSIVVPYTYHELADDTSVTVISRIVLQLCQEFNMTIDEILESPWYDGYGDRLHIYAAREVKKENRNENSN